MSDKTEEQYVLNLWEWGFWTILVLLNILILFVYTAITLKICVIFVVIILSISDLFLPDLDDNGISTWHRDTPLEKFVKRLEKVIRLVTVGFVAYLSFL